MDDHAFISTEDAASQLKYTRQHVRRLVRDGKLDGEKVGRDWLVSVQSVHRHLAVRENLPLPFDANRNLDESIQVPEDEPLTVESILGGAEPSLDLKRLAKRLAWAGDDAPRQTMHRIYRGDARQMEELDAESVDLVVSSPPYFNLIEYSQTFANGQLGNMDDYTSFLDELDAVWRRCYEVLKPGSRLCIVVGDVCVSRKNGGRHHVIPLHADIIRRCMAIGFDYLTPIYWAKIANMATEVGGSARFLGKPYEPNAIIKNDVEYILLLRKPGGYRKPTAIQRALSVIDAVDHRRWFQPVWSDIRGEGRKAGHPAPYPMELARRLIMMFSFVGDTVLDPFWGTGSTTRAAISAVRSSVGYEIEDEYLEIGKRILSQGNAADVQPKIKFLKARGACK